MANRAEKRPKAGSQVPSGKKSPTAPASAPSGKNPIALPREDSSDKRLCWRFDVLDVDGPFGNRIPDEHWPMIIDNLRKIETMTLREVFNQGDEPGKHYEIQQLPTKESHRRLAELGYDDQDRISRLRFGGTLRLYGFLRGNIFHVLWWDPDHKVYPSPKRHT